MRSLLALLSRILAPIALQLLCLCSAANAQEIRNVASFSWSTGGVASTIESNPVTLTGPAPAPTYVAYGFAFEYGTGRPVNGARISLISESTGRILETVLSGMGPDATQPAQPVDSGPMAFEGVSGTWIPGQFAFSPAPAGLYRLQIVAPAGMRVALDSIIADTAYTAPDGTWLDVSEGSRGEPFELTSYAQLDLDVPLEQIPPATLAIDMTANVGSASFGDAIDYQLRITNESVDSVAEDVVVASVLPNGLSFVPRSLRINGAQQTPTLDAPRARFLAPIGNLSPGASITLNYSLLVGPNAPLGRAINSGTLSSATGNSDAAAEAAVQIEPALMSDGITILGRVTSGTCADPKGVAGARVVLESGAYAITDSNGLYHFEGVRPGNHVVQLDTSGLPAGAKPAACGDNTRRAGSSLSQFVDVAGGLIARADFHVTIPETGAVVDTAVAPALPGMEPAENLFADQQPGIDWIMPALGLNPRAPALRIVIKHGVKDKVQLSINGEAVALAMFEGVATDPSATISISQWRGIPITEGENLLEARVTRADGIITRLTRTIHYANAPARAALASEQSKLIADGAHRPVIAVRILDAAGKPIRTGVTGGVRVSSPYRLAAESEAQQSRQLAGTERFAPTFRVIDDTGLALIELEPTTTPGWVELNFEFPGAAKRRAEPVRAWLSADREDWIVVGFAAGTLGFNQLAGNSEPLVNKESDTSFQDGQVTFYAKGRVLGRWLLTVAYDSEKHADESSLLSVIDPNRYYALYGDASTVGYDAASSKKIYLRLERDTFYAMFGDFETGFTDTQLSRFSRTLTGVKAESASETINAAVFAAETAQRNRRDEIAGNGLSGPYALSSSNIITNTESVRIETRDRMHSERIVATRNLVRHIDYDIDYGAATLRFRQPVLSKDSDLNPIYIVAEYETYGEADSTLAAGVRVTADIADDRVRLGATAVTDEQSGAGRMAGVDLVAHIDEATTVRLETALSDTAAGKAGAWLAEAQHTDGDTDVLLYARRQDAGFGLGQSPLGQSGSEKIGFDLRHKVAQHLMVSGAASHEEALATGATRASAEGRIEQNDDEGGYFLGLRTVVDTTANATTRSNQLLIGASRFLFDHKLEVSESSDFNIGDTTPSAAFPTRHRIAAAYAFTDSIRLTATHEITPTGAQKGSATQVGFDVKPWGGARLSTTLSQTAIAERGERTFAQYGLSQSLPIGDRWTVDATYDSGRTVSGTTEGPAAATPISSGALVQQDFDAATAGATYRAETWSWNGRVEYRTSQDESRLGLISNSLNQLNAVTSLATSFRAQSRTDRLGREINTAEGSVSAAYRPADSPWTLLARTKASFDNAGAGASPALPTSTTAGFETLRIVSVLSANFDEGPVNPWSGSVYYGSKQVFSDADAVNDDSHADILGIDVRHDLGADFDLGLSAAVRRQADLGLTRFTVGPSLGWSPQDNLWVSIGYNLVGFRDRDFEENRYTRQGAYVTFRFKFDQTSFGSALAASPAADGLAGSVQ